MKEFIEQYEGLLVDGERYRATINEQKEQIKDLLTQVHKYQSKYHDISVGDLHQKITYLETTTDQQARANIQLNAHIKHLNRNIDLIKDDLIFYKEKAHVGVHGFNKNPWGYEQKYQEERNWTVSLSAGTAGSASRPRPQEPSSDEASIDLGEDGVVLEDE